MKVFIGWDPVDENAYRVAKQTLEKNASIPLQIFPLKEHELRAKKLFWRGYHMDEQGQRWDAKDGKPFSTQFSFTRFCVPALCDYEDEWVLFMDPDMLIKGDVAELLNYTSRSLYCVQHVHEPPMGHKMGGFIQTRYIRKNWSSFMLMNPSRNMDLTQFRINNEMGSWLHAMLWLRDEDIGELPEAWNWLEGHSNPSIIPKNIHYTRGTPDLPDCETVDRAAEWWHEFEALPAASD